MPARLRIYDLAPKFLAFYERAQGTDPETRWALWQDLYNYAAVPPTPEGKQMARRLLDDSFGRYPEVLDRIRAGAAGFQPPLEPLLEATCRQLEFDGDLEIHCTLYVGNLEMNAWAATVGGKAYVNFPLEWPMTTAPWVIPHEFTHVLHSKLCNDPGGWLRSIGFTMMQEGLAIWASRFVVPGLPESPYISREEPDWLERCRAKEQAILTGIRPYVAEATNEALMRFLMGSGSTGETREAYYVGYRVVAQLIAEGRTLAELARIPEADVIALMDRTLAELTA